MICLSVSLFTPTSNDEQRKLLAFIVIFDIQLIKNLAKMVVVRCFTLFSKFTKNRLSAGIVGSWGRDERGIEGSNGRERGGEGRETGRKERGEEGRSISQNENPGYGPERRCILAELNSCSAQV